jgi:hypothetical protein
LAIESGAEARSPVGFVFGQFEKVFEHGAAFYGCDGQAILALIFG